jgi:two-component system, NarL family, sensor histidine kinase UhpB
MHAATRDHSQNNDKVLHALVVEDSIADFELLVEYLRPHYQEVTSARVDDEQALSTALTDQKWDIVLADHNLPRLSSGYALQIKKSLAPELPFIIVSGLIGEDVAVDAMHSGADDYVNKNQLARLVPAIERSRSAAEVRRQKLEAEASLEEKRSQLAAITRNMHGIVFQLAQSLPNGPFRLTYLGDAAEKFLGLPQGGLPGHEQLLEKLFDPADIEGLVHSLNESRDAQKILHWEGRLNRYWLPPEERRARWVELAVTPRDARGGHALFDGILIDITQHKRTEGRLARSRQQLRELSAHLERVKEEERAAIAREVHDDIGGTLTGLKVDIAWLHKHVVHDPAVKSKLHDINSLVDIAFSASKRIMLKLRPSILDFGIVPALEWLLDDFKRRHGIGCAFECNVEELQLNADLSSALFRILQEALTNIVKHANATHVDVYLFADAEMVSLEVCDNGSGILTGAQTKAGRFGIRGIRERVEQLDGWLEIYSQPQHGVTIMLSIPRERSGPSAQLR